MNKNYTKQLKQIEQAEQIDAAELLALIKKHGIDNPITYRTLLSITIDYDNDILENFWDLVMPSILYNKLFTSPFAKPNSEVNGLIKFAITENNKPVGINPADDECHVLIAGQTGTGKSTLLKIIFAQALNFNERKKHE